VVLLADSLLWVVVVVVMAGTVAVVVAVAHGVAVLVRHLTQDRFSTCWAHRLHPLRTRDAHFGSKVARRVAMLPWTWIDRLPHLAAEVEVATSGLVVVVVVAAAAGLKAAGAPVAVPLAALFLGVTAIAGVVVEAPRPRLLLLAASPTSSTP
jgi:hypothetical protein